ncbi:MAG TPA: hypothetical protein DCE47_14030 [Planctomycetaceae bacterium]|nr:hypothetical protein [Planctomycetaceae bacterium]
MRTVVARGTGCETMPGRHAGGNGRKPTAGLPILPRGVTTNNGKAGHTSVEIAQLTIGRFSP